MNLTDPVTLHELRKFVETAEQNCTDPDMDLREYDENNDLIGLAAVGEMGSGETESDASEEESDASEEESDASEEESAGDQEVLSDDEPC